MRVLFVSPLAGIEQHAIVERKLLQNFLARGDSVGVIRCEGDLFQPCGVALAKGTISPVSRTTRRFTCAGCVKNGQLLFGSDPKIQQFSIAGLISPEEVSEIHQTALDATPDGWKTLERKGLPIGRLAAYEGFLTYKDHSGILSGQQLADYRANLRTVLTMACVSEKVINEWSPDLVIAYNTLYALHRVWKLRSEDHGIPCYSLQHGWDAARRSSTLMIYRDDNEQLLLSSSPESDSHLEVPLGEKAIALVARHLLALTQATNVFVYSAAHQAIPPREIRSRLGLDDDRPVIFVPLSSEDERFASGAVGLEFMNRPGKVFTSQMEFLEFLKFLAKQHPQWQFLIRVHPRMFPNSRESYLATAAEPLMALLSTDCPENFRVNTPDQGLSLSDIIQVVDLVVAGRSTVGAQCAAYGLPLVLHDVQQLNAFSARLGQVATSRDEFPAKIQAGLDIGCCIENSIIAFRWFNFLNNVVAKDISPSESQDSEMVLDAPTFRHHTSRRLSRLLPGFLRAWLKARISFRIVDGFSQHLATHYPEIDDLVKVTDRKLAGLHQLKSPTPFESFATEREGVMLALLDLCENLGSFPDDPRCLTSRIQNWQDTADS